MSEPVRFAPGGQPLYRDSNAFHGKHRLTCENIPGVASYLRNVLMRYVQDIACGKEHRAELLRAVRTWIDHEIVIAEGT